MNDDESRVAAERGRRGGVSAVDQLRVLQAELASVRKLLLNMVAEWNGTFRDAPSEPPGSAYRRAKAYLDQLDAGARSEDPKP
jgi:hypothetical protein